MHIEETLMKLNICLFFIRDDELLEKINETLEKVTNSIKIKEFDSKLVFDEECKYVLKEKKMRKYITDDIEIYNDSDREDSDEKGSDKENSDKKSLAKKILVKKIKHKM